MLSKDAFKVVLEALPKLDLDQRNQVAAKIKALNSLGPGNGDYVRAIQYAPADPDAAKDFLFEGICFQLQSMGLITRDATGSLKRSRSYKVYNAKSLSVARTLLAEKNKIPDTPAARVALGRLAGRCLAQLVGSWATISPQILLCNVDKIPEAIDRQFPGYLQNGLLAQLVLRPTGSPFKLPNK